MISRDEAVDSKCRIVLCNLLGLNLCQGSDGVQTRVLGQGQGNRLQGISEPTEGVLLNCLDLD